MRNTSKGPTTASAHSGTAVTSPRSSRLTLICSTSSATLNSTLRAVRVDDTTYNRWTSYRYNALGQDKPYLFPHPLYLVLGNDDKTRRVIYQSRFRAELDNVTITDIRSTGFLMISILVICPLLQLNRSFAKGTVSISFDLVTGIVRVGTNVVRPACEPVACHLDAFLSQLIHVISAAVELRWHA